MKILTARLLAPRSPENQPSPAIVGARHGVPLQRAARMILMSSGGPQAHEYSPENRPKHVIPLKGGIQFVRNVDPRLLGGDEKDFHFLGWAESP
jgi:hypothetical protein